MPLPIPKAHPTSTTRILCRPSHIPVPTTIPQGTYADAVLVEDVNEAEEASEEEIVTPITALLEKPLIRTVKRTRTKEKLWIMGHANVPKY